MIVVNSRKLCKHFFAKVIEKTLPLVISYFTASNKAKNESASKLAPPTKAPSTFSFAIYSAMFSGLTEPPY